jgi:2-polyprenyl-3-methyl-5-hydroxy-6-metoxy-1,4-benzoquinol methylase
MKVECLSDNFSTISSRHQADEEEYINVLDVKHHSFIAQWKTASMEDITVEQALSNAYGWWKSTYEGVVPEDLPWFSPTPDPDLAASLKQFDAKPGLALDLGSGPGTHAIALAKAGWNVVAVDISPGAIRMASQFAEEAGVKIDFRNANVLSFQPRSSSFDLVHDRGFLHTLEPTEWKEWADLVAIALKPSGLLFAKEFAYNPRRHSGPRGFTRSELESVLDNRFQIQSLTESTFRGVRFAHTAFLLIARRKPK